MLLSSYNVRETKSKITSKVFSKDLQYIIVIQLTQDMNDPMNNQEEMIPITTPILDKVHIELRVKFNADISKPRATTNSKPLKIIHNFVIVID